MVINVVGLTPSLIGPHTPRIAQLAGANNGHSVATIRPSLPAVTCTQQATYLTGALPQEHGIVGNGWYFKDDCEIRFWRQSDKLVQRPRIWEIARKIDPGFTVANCFWWYAMYSSADYTVTPRPMYPADGRKLPDVWTHPPALRGELQRTLGQFPLFKFWGPGADIDSSRWITSSAIEVDRRFNPTLNLVYLPHLDYCLQKYGPGAPEIAAELTRVDAEVGRLLDHAGETGTRVIVLSEYGISAVNQPIHINRALRQAGLITVRDELGHELLDAGASAAFAVADHQIAHVYLNDESKRDAVRQVLKQLPGVAGVFEGEGRREIGLNHDRAGDFVCLSQPNAWFTYYYWLNDERAADFAHTVEIHRKPGYDPVELFLDPKIKSPKLTIGRKLIARKLGFRALLDVIPLDANLVRGSHGVVPTSSAEAPVLISSQRNLLDRHEFESTDVLGVILNHCQAG